MFPRSPGSSIARRSMRNGSAAGSTRRILDTNLLVYQHDSYDREKQARANQVVWRASAAYGTAVTNQVLADFASIVIRPRRQLLPPGQASAQIERLARQFVVL